MEGSTEQYTSRTQADIGRRYILNTKAIGVNHLKQLRGNAGSAIDGEGFEDASYFLGVDVLTAGQARMV